MITGTAGDSRSFGGDKTRMLSGNGVGAGLEREDHPAPWAGAHWRFGNGVLVIFRKETRKGNPWTSLAVRRTAPAHPGRRPRRPMAASMGPPWRRAGKAAPYEGLRLL